MKVRTFFKISLMVLFLLSFVNAGPPNEIRDPILTLEIYTDGEIKRIEFQSKDIEEVGINESTGEPRLEITFIPKFHSTIEKLTEENRGKRAVIRTGDETIFSGIIRETIRGGKVAPSCASAEQARAIIEKMGREPDYHLKLNPEEIGASKRYTEPLKSPWAQKALDASDPGSIYYDLEEAEKYAKKAIESDPNEPGYHTILGLIYYKQGKKKLALDEALMVERLSNEEDLRRFPGTYLNIAQLYAGFNEYDKAIEYYQRVLSTNKNNPLAHLGLAEVYESMGKTDLALKEYVFLSKSDDEDVRMKGREGIRRVKGN